MLISHKYKFIFIHNYKVAGRSLKRALGSYALQDAFRLQFVNMLSEYLMPDIPLKRGLPRGLGCILPLKRFDPHAKSTELRRAIGEKRWSAYYTFGFVRNPWDHQVSLYHYIRGRPQHPHYSIVSERTFEEFVMWRNMNDIDLQKSFFYDEAGKPLVSFIGRFEELEKDFEKIAKEIGISCSLPKVGASKRKTGYREYYTERAKDLVSHAFREDIETFGYAF